MENTSRKKELQSSAGIFLLALAVRLIYLYQSSAGPSFATPVVDAGIYDLTARLVVAGKGINYNGNFFWQPPFYPAFLSLIYSISNSSIICAKVVQALLGAVSCLLTYRLGTRIFNRTAGITAGCMVAVYGPLIFFEQELLASGWAVFWSLVLILLFLDVSAGENGWRCFALGICGAVSIITRPTFLLFFWAAVVWLVIIFYRQERQRRRLVLKTALILAGFLLIAIPVAVKNLRVTGHFGILPASGGINLFVGNNSDYIKTITARPGRDWAKITHLPSRSGVAGNMWEQQEYFKARLFDFARTRPFAFARGLAYKTVQSISAREIPRNVDVYLFRKWSGLLGALVWKVNGFGFPFGVLLPLTLLGLIGCWRQIPVPLKLFLFFYPLSLILVFVTARYRVPVIPVMAVVAAAGLLKLISMMRSRSWKSLAITSIGGVAVLLASTLPGPFPQELANFEAELYANVAGSELDREQTKAAIAHLNKALSLQPDYPSAHGNLGMALTRQGRFDAAIRHYHIALELDDNSAEVHNNLATTYAAVNNMKKALAHYSRALEISPGYAEAHYNLGNLLLAAGRTEEAIDHLRRAVQTDNDLFKAHNSLAVALTRKGNIELAVHHFSRAIALRPDEQQPRYNLAMIFAGCGRTKEAASQLQALLQIPLRTPEDLDYLAGLLNTLARSYAAKGNFVEAAATAEKALHISTAAGQKNMAEYFQSQTNHYRGRITEK